MRTTIGAARRRKKNRLFQKAKGYTGGRGRLYRSVKETVVRAEAFAFRDRRARKREFRKEIAEYMKKGFQRIRVDGTYYEIADAPALAALLEAILQAAARQLANNDEMPVHYFNAF